MTSSNYSGIQSLVTALKPLYDSSSDLFKKQYLLFKYQRDIKDRFKFNDEFDEMNVVLYSASSRADVRDVTWALSLGADVNYQEPLRGHTSLMKAAISVGTESVEIVRLLLASGANPNTLSFGSPESQQLAALWAAFYGNHESVKLITESPLFNAELHSDSPSRGYWKNGCSPDRDLATVHLLKAGVVLDNAGVRYVDRSHPQGWSADQPNAELYYKAIESGAIHTVRQLLETGMRIESRPDRPLCMSPLAIAAQFGQLEICKLLIQNGANPNLMPGYKHFIVNFPLSKAALHGHFDVVEYLISQGADTAVLKDITLSQANELSFEQAVERGLNALQAHHKMSRMHLALGCHERVGQDSHLKQAIVDNPIGDPNIMLLISGFLPGAPEQHQKYVEKHEEIEELIEVDKSNVGASSPKI